jgi:hypothetical protein
MPSIERKRLLTSAWTLALLLPLALTDCVPATRPGATASATYSDQATAKVIGVNKSDRLITLQDPEGQVGTVQAPEAVRNFDQITTGDTVLIDYQKHIVIEVQGNVAPIPGVIVQTAVARAPKGHKPGGIFLTKTRRSVEIVSVDRASHTVTFREPDGTLDSLVVENPKNFALADGLRPGTVVDVTETDSTALAVQKL